MRVDRLAPTLAIVGGNLSATSLANRALWSRWKLSTARARARAANKALPLNGDSTNRALGRLVFLTPMAAALIDGDARARKQAKTAQSDARGSYVLYHSPYHSAALINKFALFSPRCDELAGAPRVLRLSARGCCMPQKISTHCCFRQGEGFANLWQRATQSKQMPMKLTDLGAVTALSRFE